MLVILGSLNLIYRQLRHEDDGVSAAERWLVRAPFSLYLGWISVATIANVSTVLVHFGWGAWGIAPEIWTAIMLSVGVILTGLMVFQRNDFIYAGVIIWAFTGIAVKHTAVMAVSSAAWVSTGIVIILTVFWLTRRVVMKRRALRLADMEVLVAE